MSTPDHLYRFVFEHANVRGEIVQLEDSFRSVIERRQYPPLIRDLVGQAMAAAALLTASVKFRGSLTVQVQGRNDQGLNLLVVQCNSHGGLRAVARWQDPLPAGASLGELCPGGHLVITIDPEGGERYQGVVAVEGETLASALDSYFNNSEQLATRVFLAADAGRAAGMLVQRLPGETVDEDAWNRAEQLAQTIRPEELLGLNAPEILHRLFHEEDIRLFDPAPFHFQCTCSRERVAEMLRSLGQAEAQTIIQEQGQVEVHCDFCNEAYRYDAVDVEHLFAAGASDSTPDTRH